MRTCIRTRRWCTITRTRTTSTIGTHMISYGTAPSRTRIRIPTNKSRMRTRISPTRIIGTGTELYATTWAADVGTPPLRERQATGQCVPAQREHDQRPDDRGSGRQVEGGRKDKPRGVARDPQRPRRDQAAARHAARRERRHDQRRENQIHADELDRDGDSEREEHV